MNQKVVSIAVVMVVCVSLSSSLSHAQRVPGIPPGIQNVIDRQVVNAQEQALERVRQQAAEKAAQQALQQTAQQVIDRVQNQTVEQVVEQAVEQVTQQVTEQAVGQVAQQVVEQTVEQVSRQVTDQAVGQVAQQLVEQTVEQVSQQVMEGAVGQVAQQVTEQAVRQVAEQVVGQAVEQVAGQAVVQVQNQVADQVVQQAVQQTVQQAQNLVANQADSLQNQTLELVQEQAARLQDGPGRLLAQTQNQEQSPEQTQNEEPASGLDSILAEVQEIPPPIYPSPLSQLPERLPINDNDGNEAFVEIRIEPNIRILEREWVMLINADQRQVLINQAPQLMQFLQETVPFEAMNSFLFKFRVPPDLDNEDAVLELLPESLHNLVDRNHVYSAEAEAAPTVSMLTLPMMSVCNRQLSVGMIDSAVREDHPAFAPGGRRTPLVTRAFIDQDLVQPSGHGTAVAGVMIGHTQGLQPLLPNATLYSASVVYAQDAYNQGATVLNLMQALDWLISIEDLQVINISMTGPPNRLLAQGVAAAQQRGKVIVAAAGNEGPFSPPLYPAAYEGVVSATAVAVDTSIYRWANQGEHMDFAALGVSVVTARGDGTIGAESGTSMATPIVSAFFACEMAAQNGDLTRALQNLRARAVDLGAPGRDPVYGDGLLHPRP